MHNEIERKFLVEKIPNLRGISPVPQERYFIQSGGLIEEGFKKRGSVYEHELKVSVNPNEKTRERILISKEEFEKNKKRGTKSLFRDSYLISKRPLVYIKKYKGDYDGLVLAEVEFDSEDEAENFKPFSWMGAEVTNTKVGKDASLVLLTPPQYMRIVEDLEEKFNFDESEGGVV